MQTESSSALKTKKKVPRIIKIHGNHGLLLPDIEDSSPRKMITSVFNEALVFVRGPEV